MMNDRNLTSHTYKELLAKEIFIRIESYLPVLKKTYTKLEQKYVSIYTLQINAKKDAETSSA